MIYIFLLTFIGIVFTLFTRGVEGGTYLIAPFALTIYFIMFSYIIRFDKMVGRTRKRLEIIVLGPVCHLSGIYCHYGFGGYLEVFLSVLLSWCAYLMLDKIVDDLSNWLEKGDAEMKKYMFRFPPKEEADYSFYVWMVWLVSLLPWAICVSWDVKMSLFKAGM